jgi:hypothetical protein
MRDAKDKQLRLETQKRNGKTNPRIKTELIRLSSAAPMHVAHTLQELPQN